MQHNSGFTLVEVLVALLVLALALTAWQLRISGQLDNAGYLRDKTLAQWVAHDQLQYLQLAQRLGGQLRATAQRGTSVYAGRTWYWQSMPEPAAMGASREVGSSTVLQPPVPVVITVAASSDELAASPLVALTGVLDATAR